MKTVLLVPGFRETFTTKDYASVVAAIERKGYTVKFVPIRWTRTTIKDWVRQLEDEYAKHNPGQTILAGFSYGSMTAFMAAVRSNPAELWLFSLSPYFSDDIPSLKKLWLKRIGQRRVDAFKTLDFTTLVKNIQCKTLIIVGELELAASPLINRRSIIAHEHIADSQRLVAPNAGHDITHKNYITTIAEAI